MTDFRVDKEKAKAALLYVLVNVPNIDAHRLYKILYFAEQQHLVKYGRPITGDAFIKMNYGPVPSYVRDKVEQKLDNDGSVSKDGNIVIPADYPDLDEFSETDLECLDNSIEQYKDKNFTELVRSSHDAAWESASMSFRIDSLSIAKSANADEGILSYIAYKLEDNNPVF